MNEDLLKRLAGDVPLEDMDQSVIMSARQGQFTKINRPNRSDSSFLDMSALSALPANPKRNAMERMMEQTAQS